MKALDMHAVESSLSNLRPGASNWEVFADPFAWMKSSFARRLRPVNVHWRALRDAAAMSVDSTKDGLV